MPKRSSAVLTAAPFASTAAPASVMAPKRARALRTDSAALPTHTGRGSEVADPAPSAGARGSADPAPAAAAAIYG